MISHAFIGNGTFNAHFYATKICYQKFTVKILHLNLTLLFAFLDLDRAKELTLQGTDVSERSVFPVTAKYFINCFIDHET